MLQFSTAATVICLRRQPGPWAGRSATTLLRFADALPTGLTKPSFAALQLFGLAEQVSFESGWEVLMAQREVKNWLRSTPERDATRQGDVPPHSG